MPLANLHATCGDSALFRRPSRCVGRVLRRMRARARACTQREGIQRRLLAREDRELVRCIPDSATRPAEKMSGKKREIISGGVNEIPNERRGTLGRRL